MILTHSIIFITNPLVLNYHNKRFRSVSISENGEVSGDLIFHYSQFGDFLTCSFEGQNILKGHLIGLADEGGKVEMRYHQVNRNGMIDTGICQSSPEILENGKLRLHEKWHWTSGDGSRGESILEAI